MTPPYTGFGTEEDSLGSVTALRPKAPRKDFKKYIEYDGKVLRFAARMISDRPENQERKFTVSYFLADDTVLVFEPPQRYAFELRWLVGRMLMRVCGREEDSMALVVDAAVLTTECVVSVVTVCTNNGL